VTTNGDIVREVARRIEGRWAEDLSVPTLAAKAGYSLHHFSRLFAGVLGVTPKEYVLRRRVSEAARELAGGKRRVTDIAFDYGFNDLETFSRAFRRTLGATPSAVRRGAVFPYFPGVASDARSSANGPSPVSGKLPVMESFPGCGRSAVGPVRFTRARHFPQDRSARFHAIGDGNRGIGRVVGYHGRRPDGDARLS